MRKAKEAIKTSKRMFLINMDLRLRSYMYQIKRTFVLEFGENAANLRQTYTWTERVNFYEKYKGNIKSVLFDDIKKGVFTSAKFYSLPELVLARVLEQDNEVIN